MLLEYFFRCPSSSRLPAQQHHSWGAVISRHAVKLKNGQAWCPRLWLHCEQMSLLDLEGQRHDLMAPLPVDLWKVLEKLEAGEKLKTNMQCAYLQKTPFCFFFGGDDSDWICGDMLYICSYFLKRSRCSTFQTKELIFYAVGRRLFVSRGLIRIVDISKNIRKRLHPSKHLVRRKRRSNQQGCSLVPPAEHTTYRS